MRKFRTFFRKINWGILILVALLLACVWLARVSYVWLAAFTREMESIAVPTQTISPPTAEPVKAYLTVSDAQMVTVSQVPEPEPTTTAVVFTAIVTVTATPLPSPTPSPSPSPSPTPPPPYTNRELELLSKTVWGEARGCSWEEQRLVIWTVFQRVDADGWGDTIEAVLTAKGQFVGCRESNPIEPEIYALCAAEADKWAKGEEPPTLAPYAPTTPYYYFDGRAGHNWFRERWK